MTATTETRVVIYSNPAFVDVPLRLWRVMSRIAATQRAIIASVSKGHMAYERTEVANPSMVTLDPYTPSEKCLGPGGTFDRGADSAMGWTGMHSQARASLVLCGTCC